MKYIIKSSKLNQYYKSTIMKHNIYHFTSDIDYAYKFISLKKAKLKLEELSNLREYKNFEIISYRKKVKHVKN